MESSHAAYLSVPRTGKSEVTTLDHAGAATLPPLLTVEETAEQLHIGRQSFTKVKSGEIESALIDERGRHVPRVAVIEHITGPRQ
ncbi:hypothetical protein GCM10009560_64270 [Nonomuraea longicatena]|uniref:Helix-turn-helix domain-containing protein n=1 Tax=Nonomuraea longicatena TaxID=83682 RepID=A0ABN1QUP0_9ACTN